MRQPIHETIAVLGVSLGVYQLYRDLKTPSMGDIAGKFKGPDIPHHIMTVVIEYRLALAMMVVDHG